MSIFTDINPDVKVTVLFGGSAFILSLLIGLLFGVGIGTVFIRSFIFLAFFAGIAYGSLLILKNFVPEIYNLFFRNSGKTDGPEISGDNIDESDESDESIDKGDMEPQTTGSGVEDDSKVSQASEGEGRFSELNQEDLPHMTSEEASAQGSENIKTGKLGKHILETEKLAKYEPKIIAQAIRTMISKDEA